MKVKIYFLTLLLGLVITGSSCNSKEDAVLPGNSTDRVISKMVEYKDVLLASDYGWKLLYKTDNGATFNFVIDFQEQNRVEMMSDFTADKSNSSWKLSPEQGILLSFDTYSLLHVLADPGLKPQGKGYLGDFEFMLGDINENGIEMVGRKHKQSFNLVRMTLKEYEDIQTIVKINETFFTAKAPLFRVLTDASGTPLATLVFNIEEEYIDFYYQNENNEMVIQREVPFQVIPEGIELGESLNFKGLEFRFLYYKGGNELHVGSNDLKVVETNTPSEFIGAYDQFYGEGRPYYALKQSAKVAEKMNVLKAKFPNVLSIQFYWNRTGGRPALAFVASAAATQWFYLLCNKDQVEGAAQDDIYLVYDNLYSYSKSATKEEAAALCNSREALDILDLFNVNGAGSVLIPTDNPILFYMVSKDDPSVWILFQRIV